MSRGREAHFGEGLGSTEGGAGDNEEEEEQHMEEDGDVEVLSEEALGSGVLRGQDEDEEEEEAEGDGEGEGDGRELGMDGMEPGFHAGPPQDDAIHVFRGHSDSVYAVACSPSASTRVASGGGDDNACLWTIGAAEEPTTLRGHTDSVSSLAFSSDGALLASGALDGVVCLWDATSGAMKHRLEGPSGGIEWCCWHPRGALVLAGSEDFSTWLWNASSGACMSVFAGHSGSVTCGGFLPDGKHVVTGSSDATVKVWDPRTSSPVSSFSGHAFHSDAITSMAFRPDGVVLTGSTDKTAAVLSIPANKIAGKLVGHDDSVECVALHNTLPVAATGSLDSKLCLWDLNTLQVRSVCEHPDGVVQLAWHPTHPELLISGCTDGSVRVWDGRVGTEVRTFMGHKDAVLSMAVTGDGLFILAGSNDKSCRVFAF